MMSLPQIAAAVVAAGSIGGAGIALDKMHVASEDFKNYIEQQQDEEFLVEALADLTDELCELRPEDKLCGE
jgi:hypothetical protein